MRTATASSPPPSPRSATSRRLRRPSRRAGPLLAAQARHEVHEVEQVFFLKGLSGHRHHSVQVRGRLGLEAAEEPHEIVEVLAGQSRHLLLTDEAGLVARRAMVKVGELPARDDLGGIDLGWARMW